MRILPSGAELWLGLDSCWCPEHIIHLLLSLGVLCGSRESGAARADRKSDCSQQCLQHLAELKDGTAGSLIICTNHRGDNDNEQESQQSPKRPLYLIRVVAVYMKSIQMSVRLVSLVYCK